MHLSPGANMAETRTGARWSVWWMIKPPDGAGCCCEHLLVRGGHDGLRLLQLIVFPHAVPQSWNQLVVYEAARRLAVHNHYEPVAVVVKTPFAAASQKPCKREPSSSKLRDGFSSSLAGRGLAPRTAEAI